MDTKISISYIIVNPYNVLIPGVPKGYPETRASMLFNENESE